MHEETTRTIRPSGPFLTRKACEFCGRPLHCVRQRKYCRDACRQRAFEQRHADKATDARRRRQRAYGARRRAGVPTLAPLRARILGLAELAGWPHVFLGPDPSGGGGRVLVGASEAGWRTAIAEVGRRRTLERVEAALLAMVPVQQLEQAAA